MRSLPRARTPELRAALAAAAIAIAVVVASLAAGPPPRSPGQQPYVPALAEPANRAESILPRGDGQFFWMLAQDPSLARPDEVVGGAEELAYRAQRPLLGYLAWASALGVSGWIAWTLIGWTAVGAVLLAWGIARCRSAIPDVVGPAALAPLLPGSLVVLVWVGPEALVTGLGLLGIARILRRGADVPALVLLSAACLGRETALLLAVGLGAHELLHGRRSNAVRVVAVPLLAVAAWFTVVRWRTGHWPWESGDRRTALPFTGVIEAASGWAIDDWSIFALTVALVLAGLQRPGTRALMACLLVPHLVLGATMSELVWARWADWGRPLLPVAAIGLALATRPREWSVTPHR